MTFDINHLLDSRYFFENAKPSTILEDIQKKINREELVREYKEIYSKEYLLKNKLVTPEEYRTIKGESFFQNRERRIAEATNLMHLVVGAERLN